MTNILVVEDEAIIAEDLERTLLRLGYSVCGVEASASDAIARMREDGPDLVLMDIKLRGGSDGIDAAATARQEIDVPVIFLTSHSDEATLTRATAVSPHGYLLKPFDERALRVAIEVALQKHRLERRLAARERWLATTLQSLGDGVIATDARCNVTFMNAAAERITGWSNTEAVGRSVDEVIRLFDPRGAALANPLERALEDGEGPPTLSPPAELVTRRGERVDVADAATRIEDATGEVLGAVMIFRDITEQQRMAERLARAERLASLERVAAGVGHEINNPLMVITGNAELAHEEVTLLGEALGASAEGPRLRELTAILGEIREAGERVRRVVHELQRLTREPTPTSRSVELADAVARALKTAGVEAELRLGSTPPVAVEEDALAQVLAILLVNARQATRNGAVRVVASTAESGAVVVDVVDEGEGIAPDLVARVFEPFFTTRATGEGSGLGLAVAHHIVTAIGGDIACASTLGRGTTFRVTLPAAERPRGRVFIVDDDLAVARSLARVLAGEHDVVMAADAADALSQLTGHADPDLVLCDVMMPQMNGVELYEAVRAVRPEIAARFVFMTGGASSPRVAAFLATAVKLAKPFDPATARALVRARVAQRRSATRD